MTTEVTDDLIKCVCCESQFEPDEIENTPDGAMCEDCRSEYFYCANCEDFIHIDSGHYADDAMYCTHCFDDIFFSCYECGEIHRRDDALLAEGDLYCQDCFDNSFYYCDDCG